MVTRAAIITTGAIASLRDAEGRIRACWLRQRCRLMRRPCLVAELIAGGQWAALDRLIDDLDADGGGA